MRRNRSGGLFGFAFLIVQGKVLDVGVHALAVHALHHGSAHFAGQQAVLAVILEVTSGEGGAVAQDTGVLCAATAFGKTAVGAYLAAQRKINTLVLVHNAEIMKNRLKVFEKFLQIDEVLPEYIPPKKRAA